MARSKKKHVGISNRFCLKLDYDILKKLNYDGKIQTKTKESNSNTYLKCLFINKKNERRNVFVCF
jgi:hypothetical protein